MSDTLKLAEATDSGLRLTTCSPWLSMDDAPRDGTLIYGLYDGKGIAIRWAETRRCMLAGIGGGNGYFGAGWEDDYNGLIMDPPEAWMSEDDFEENVQGDGSPDEKSQPTR